MTSEQKAAFDDLWLAEQPFSRRLGAPAGSGKTFVAVKLAVCSVREQLGSGVIAPVLLLSHTRGLKQHTLHELRGEIGEAN